MISIEEINKEENHEILAVKRLQHGAGESCNYICGILWWSQDASCSLQCICTYFICM